MSTVEVCPSPLAEVSVEGLEEEFEILTPEERIERTVDLFAGRVAVATTCGPTAPVLLEKVGSVAPELPILNVRTHHETPETAAIVAWFEQESGFNFYIHDAEPMPVPPIDSPAFVEFQRLVKEVPFQEMLDKFQPSAYLSGAMRWQSAGRKDLPIVEKKGSVLAIRPVADVSQAEAEALLEQTELPYPKDYFDPAKGPDQNLECGLNTACYR